MDGKVKQIVVVNDVEVSNPSYTTFYGFAEGIQPIMKNQNSIIVTTNYCRMKTNGVQLGICYKDGSNYRVMAMISGYYNLKLTLEGY